MNDELRASCHGKKRYESWTAANTAAHPKRRHRSRHKAHGHRQVYRCRFCQGWHVGGSPLR